MIQVYNPSSKDCSFMEGRIYSIEYRYFPLTSKDTVLINGTSFYDLSPEEGVTALENLGISFSKKDKEEFLAIGAENHSSCMFTHSLKYDYSVYSDDNYKEDGSTYVERICINKRLQTEP